MNDVLTVAGTSALSLTTAGDLNFPLTSTGFSGKIDLASGTSLSIDGQAYTIIHSLGAEGSTTGADLQGMRGNLSGYYALGSDIDASATSTWNYYATGGYYYGFQPVGDDTYLFAGTFNGLGHSITNLFINRASTTRVGLFGDADTAAIVRNIAQINATITGNNYVGGIVGSNYGLVKKTYSTATVNGATAVGGIVGINRNSGTVTESYADATATGSNINVGGLVGNNAGTISDSTAEGDATGPNYIGGLVGQNGGTVTNSHATGNATASVQYAGGLVGYNTLSISSSYATGTINSAGYSGGLVGENHGSASSITDSYATGAVGATARYSGGLVGDNDGTVSGSHASGAVSGTSSVGGLVGENNRTLENSYATGNVTGTGNYTGGLVGANYLTGSIANSYAETGTVSGNTYTGGLVGYSRGNIAGSHSGNTVSGATNTGGLVGRVADAVTAVTTSYTTSNVTGTGDYTGAFAGYNNGTITLGTASGTANGVTYVGALVGFNNNTINGGSYATGSANGGDDVGGLVGRNVGSLSDVHASAEASGANNVGGLVGANDGGSISNAYATGNATATTDCAGGLAGYNTSSITLSHASGTATGGGHAGGLVGFNEGTGSSVTDSYATGTVSATARFSGGLVGENEGTVSGSYATGAVSGTISVGGLIGENQEIVIDSYATGNVTGTGTYTGGLAGANYLGSSITNSYATGTVQGAQYTGGLVGYSRGNVTGSHATGDVNGTGYVGGLIGIVTEPTTNVTTSYATGNVTSTGSNSGGFTGYNIGIVSLSYATGNTNGVNYTGGFAGRNYGAVTNSYATGNANGGNYVSAFVGYNTLNISNSYGTGLVSGTGATGGLTAYDSAGGTVVSSYWNTETTGKSTSITGASLTTAQMTTQSSFAGWDFTSTWSMVEGATYPYLQAHGTPSVIRATGNLAANTAVQVIINGTPFGTVRTAYDGSLYAILPQSALGAGSDILLYNTGGGATAANAVYTAASRVATGLSLTSSTLWANSANGVLTNTAFATALGSLSSSDIGYTASGNDLAITSAAATLQNTSTDGITVNGTITSSGSLSFNAPTTLRSNVTTSGALTFSQAVTLGTDAALDSGNAATSFESTIEGAFDLAASAGAFSFGGSIGAATPLDSISLISAGPLTLPSITATSIFAEATGSTSDIGLASNKSLSASGTGNAVKLKAGQAVILSSGSSVTASSGGNIILWSNAANLNAGSIQMTASTITSNGGNVTLAGGLDNGANGGTGGDGIPDNSAYGYSSGIHGVQINGGGINTASGTLTIRGHGRTGASSGNLHGIFVRNGAVLQSTSGAISLAGVGGDGTFDNMGIWLSTASTRIVTETGAIALTGIGGGSTDTNWGILLGSGGGEIISTGTSAAAAITLIGTGGAGTLHNYGIGIQNGGFITSSSAPIYLEGTGGSTSGYGVSLNGTSNSISASGNTSITINGVGTNTHGINFSGITVGSTVLIGGATHNGTITFNANSIQGVTTGSLNILTGGTVIFKPRTAGTTVGVGTGAGTLSISESLLSSLSAISYVFGSTDAGLLTINTTRDFGSSNVSFVSGANINLAGTLTKSSGGTAAYLFQADDDIANSNSAGISSATGSINLTLQSNHDGDGGAIYLSGGTISTNGGNVTMGGGSGAISAGSGYAIGDATYSDGITITGSINAGAGNIIINGQGGTEGASTLNGIAFTAGTILTTSGDITLHGLGGTSATSTQRVGVLVQSTLTTDSGNIRIYGTGGGGGGSSKLGIFFPGGGRIISTGTESGNGAGELVIEGTGYYAGIGIRGGLMSAVDADIRITGTGVGASAAGISFFNNSSSITSTGSGNIGITGIAAGTEGDIIFGTNSVGNQTYTIGNVLGTGLISLTAAQSGKINFAQMTTYLATVNIRTSGGLSISGLLNNTVAGAKTSLNAIAGSIIFNGPWGSLIPLTTVSLTSSNSISLPSIGVGTTGSLFVQTTGANANIATPLNTTLSAAENTITLAASGNFINESTTPFSVTGGAYWLVYSSDISSTTLNGLAPDFVLYSCTYGGSCPALGTGNGIVYTETPILAVTPNSLSIVYGDAAPSLSGYAYTLSGYLGSDATYDAVTGTLTGTTTYTQGSNVGAYNISHGSGTLSSSMGYGFTYATNATAIAVAAKTLTASLVGPISKVYDGTTAATLSSSNYSLTGFYGADTVTVATTSGAYATQNTGSNILVTVDGLTLSGAKASNYALASTSLSDTIGIITPSILVITPRNTRAIYTGAALNAEAWSQSNSNYIYTGFKGADTASNTGLTFTGALEFSGSPATVVLNPARYALTSGSLIVTDVNGNYLISFSNPARNAYTIIYQLPDTVQSNAAESPAIPSFADSASSSGGAFSSARLSLTISPPLKKLLGLSETE